MTGSTFYINQTSMKNLKVIIYSLLVLVLCAANVFGQNWSFGAQTGVTIANEIYKSDPKELLADYNLETKNDPVIGYSLNAHFEYKSKGIWGVSMEPGFMMKGTQSKAGGVKLNLLYVQIPVLSDFYLVDKLSLSIGPEFAYLLSAKRKNDFGTSPISLDKFDIAGIIGANYKIYNNLSAGVRFSNSFIKNSEVIITDSNNQLAGEVKIYNRYYQLFIRVTI
mgnify:CR=1 FL=1